MPSLICRHDDSVCPTQFTPRKCNTSTFILSVPYTPFYHGIFDFHTACMKFSMSTMANTEVSEVPSANRPEPGSFQLKFAELPPPQKHHNVNANSAASQWVETFNKAIQPFDKDAIALLFCRNSYWRDQLCLSWDLRTLHGAENILSVINKAGGLRIKSIDLHDGTTDRKPSIGALDRDGQIDVVGAFLKIETSKGNGIGHVRLVREDDHWKAFTLFTSLQELHGHPEQSGLRRPHGVRDGPRDQDRNWLQQRQLDQKLENLVDGGESLPVLIVGMSCLTSS